MSKKYTADRFEDMSGNGFTPTVFAETKDKTGFISPELIDVSYNYTNQTITLTGTLTYYWRGERKTLTSPWTSTGHSTTTNQNYYLYTTNGINFTWSIVPWTFDVCMVAMVRYGATADTTFAIREVHGLMDYLSHEELHQMVGCYRRSGGILTTGTYATNTATDVATTMGFDAAVIKDEDLSTTIPAWTEGTYTTMYIGAANTSVFNTAYAFPFTVTNPATINTYMQVNNVVTGTMTNGVNSRWYDVYQILVPVASDADSQKYRMIMLQPQATFTSQVLAQAESVLGLNLGSLASMSPEFFIYARITYVTSNTDTTNTGKCRIATNGITYLAGSQASQVSVAGFQPSNHQTLNNREWITSGHYDTANSVATFDTAGNAEVLPKTDFEIGIGNPTVNGMVLQSTSGGTRSWVNKTGFADYNDVTTQTTPISHTGGTTSTLLRNDAAGTYTSTTYLPTGVSVLWNPAANQFDFTELKLGDEVQLRIDVAVTTTQVNQEFDVDLNLSIGANPYTLNIAQKAFKTAGTYKVVVTQGFYMGNQDTIDNSAELIFTSVDDASIVVNGWYISVVRR